jgi:hypothetical protein
VVPFTLRIAVLALAAPLCLAACRGRSDRDATRANAGVTFHARDSLRTLGPGDVQIASADNGIEIALVGDSVVTGFGPKVLDEINAKTDTFAVTGNGFGASIEKMVKSSVAGALSHQLLFPVKSISDVRYTDGRLEFYNADGSRMHLFENSKSNGKDTTMTFRREDADRFIAAFHARKATIGG